MNLLQSGDMSSWATNGGENNRQCTSPQNSSYGQQLHQLQLAQQQPIGSPLSRHLQQSPPVGKSSFQNQSLLPTFGTSSASATDLLLQQSKLLENDAFGSGGSSQSLTGACNNMTTTQMINSLGLSSQHQQHLSMFFLI